jgi:hypothetical protein
MTELPLDVRDEFLARRNAIHDRLLDLFGEELRIWEDEHLYRKFRISREAAEKWQTDEASGLIRKNPDDSRLHLFLTIGSSLLSLPCVIYFLSGGYRLVAAITEEYPAMWFSILTFAVLIYKKVKPTARAPRTFVELAKQYAGWQERRFGPR